MKTPAPERRASSLLGDLHHVGIAVWDADTAAAFYTQELGLESVADEIAPVPGVRLLYLNAGTVFIQLVQPVTSGAAVAHWLSDHGEGLHHLCFSSSDLTACAKVLNPDDSSPPFPAGLGADAFFLTRTPNTVKIEITGPRPA